MKHYKIIGFIYSFLSGAHFAFGVFLFFKGENVTGILNILASIIAAGLYVNLQKQIEKLNNL